MTRWLLHGSVRRTVLYGAAIAGLLAAAATGLMAFAVASIRCCTATSGATWGGWLVLFGLAVGVGVAVSACVVALGWMLNTLWRRRRHNRT